MADASREMKLAAAKKKLKQFKKTGRSASPALNKKPKIADTGPKPEDVSSNGQNAQARGVYQPADTFMTDGRTTASTESLLQLSLQLNGLMSDTDVQNGDLPDNPSLSELQTRNRELAALLEKHRQANEELQLHIRELVHIQTIGILVAEKTELQSALTQCQTLGKQKVGEVDEIMGRLKASRQRVAELERQLSSSNTTEKQYEKTSKEYSRELDRLKQDASRLGTEKEEIKQQLSELKSKMKSKVLDCQKLEYTTQDLQSKLAMAELYAQQVSSQNEHDARQQLEDMERERQELAKKVMQVQESLQRVTDEREQLSDQYQKYTEQLNRQLHEVKLRLSSVTEERDQFCSWKEDLVGQVEELRTQLANKEQYSTESRVVGAEFAELQDEVQRLTAELDSTSRQYQSQVHDNAQLSRMLEQRHEKLQSAEMQLERYDQDTETKRKLLEAVQSDKVTISRALAQNKQLKTQLLELQEQFVKMSNDNMELTTKLDSEGHISKELAHRLTQQEEELGEVRLQLTKRERQLESFYVEQSKDMYTQDQISDRLRHYEAQSQLVETLQRELSSAQDTINALTNQKMELLQQLALQDERLVMPQEEAKKDAMMSDLSVALQQLQLERDELTLRLREQGEEHSQLQGELSGLRREIPAVSPRDGNLVSQEDYTTLRTSMEKLQERFIRAMQENADMQDRNQQMEHLIMQLQGETDTIGEYISLYHAQREKMKDRARRKDELLALLAQEKTLTQEKLGQLQALVVQLLGERRLLPGATSEKVQQILNDATNPTTFAGDLDDSQINDWPDIDVSDTEETESRGESDVPDDHQKEQETQKQVNVHLSRDDRTAMQIIQLLSQMGGPNLAAELEVGDMTLVPCKCCIGRLLVV
ncbi:PREDICTED: golgin subfamily A member 2-like isoform X2 [Priapulus caudatus]|uniref:Golgin subfamily A member 2-like isoform X2 n=1 Tax=Priapulus caudatus TaxID=37621 RepID=A0ABM1EBQ8_PRICU|nr:PREDICTED: golgin subfamily A member 2-like isoform X2 [Priapulus caudatus]